MKVRLCVESAAQALIVACALLAAAAAPAAEAFSKLSGPQIRSRFAGMDLTDEVHWRESYIHDGNFASQSMGRSRTGKWRIEDDETLRRTRRRSRERVLRGLACRHQGRIEAKWTRPRGAGRAP
jgi:hypothetical protein